MGKWARTGTVRPAPLTDAPAVAGGLIEPNDGEKRNGWTAETLTAYLLERGQATTNAVLYRPKPKPNRANSKYYPHHWRG